MKKLIIVFICISSSAMAQHIDNLPSMKQKNGYDNVVTQTLSDDSLSTATLIWIKKDVHPHYHADHDEQVYIVEGQGQMFLGSKTVFVKPGDFIFIPRGTVHGLRVTSKDKVMKVLSIKTPQFDGSDRVMVQPNNW